MLDKIHYKKKSIYALLQIKRFYNKIKSLKTKSILNIYKTKFCYLKKKKSS